MLQACLAACERDKVSQVRIRKLTESGTETINSGADAPWVIRLWEREAAQLHAVGEHCNSLSGHIAWQPNGRHLYAACARPDGQISIILYERNGLQHGSFDLHGAGAVLKIRLSQGLLDLIDSEDTRHQIVSCLPDLVFPAAHEERLVRRPTFSYRLWKRDWTGKLEGGGLMGKLFGAGFCSGMSWSPDSQLLSVTLRTEVDRF